MLNDLHLMLMSPLTSIVFISLQWKLMGTNNCLVLQNILLCVQHKKEMYSGLEQHDGNFHFLVNYSLNCNNNGP